MTDEQLALHAISEAQLLLEDYLQPRPQNNQNNEGILDKLVEVLERPDLVVAVSRLQQRSSLWVGKWENSLHQSLCALALLRSCQSGCQMRRRNNNAALRCHQIRTDIGGPIVSSMDENAGTKASPCFRNRCWSGLRRHPRNRVPVKKLQASSQRSLAIH